MTFLDASVLLAAEDADDSQHHAAVRLLRGGNLATVDLALYEVTNVALGRWRDPAAAQRLRARIWLIEEFGTVVRADERLGDDIARLVEAHGLNAYGAAYVAGARRLGETLASCDERDLVGPGLASLPSALVG